MNLNILQLFFLSIVHAYTINNVNFQVKQFIFLFFSQTIDCSIRYGMVYYIKVGSEGFKIT